MRILDIMVAISMGFLSVTSAVVAAAQENISAMSTMEKAEINKVFEKRIFFGHQSVGENIIRGIGLLDSEYEKNIIDIKDKSVEEYPSQGLLQRRVGTNRDPKKKIDDFRGEIEKQLQGDVDVAFLKLCYVDITQNTDVADLFNYYKTNFAALKESFPDVTFVHFTAPLKKNSETWKTSLKKMLGKGEIWEYADNIQRNKYSQMIVGEYQGREPVFDVAEIESTGIDGKRVSFSYKDGDYYALADELTYDGGHLNDEGSRRVAAGLLQYLSTLD